MTWAGHAPSALVVEHDAYTDPALVGERLDGRGYRITRRLVVPADRFHTPDVDHTFPDPRDWDVIVVMGAPWSADDHTRIGSWLGPELTMLRRAYASGVPVLGICFGGQALAVALGGGVVRAPGWELGWMEVTGDGRLVPDGPAIDPGPWFQFHHDAMVLPPGATELARTRICSQAWTLGRCLAVQFHPEVTLDVLDGWLAHGAREVMQGQGVDVDRLRRLTALAEPEARRRTHALVDTFLDQVATRPVDGQPAAGRVPGRAGCPG